MERLSSRFGRQWMREEAAGEGIAWDDLIESALEVQLRLLVGPGRASGCQSSKIKTSVRQNVATIAGCMARPLLQKNRLNPGFEELEIKCGDFVGRRCRGRCAVRRASRSPYGRRLSLCAGITAIHNRDEQ